MWRYVIRNPSTPTKPGLPDPEKSENPAATLKANEEVSKVLSELNSNGLKRKRGQYEYYSAELRAEIGKFAAENGNARAVRHYTASLSRKISESTVRSMKSAYIKEKKKAGPQPVNSLPHAKRGRPLLLGELDERVKSYINGVRDSGGIVNRNIVLAGARGIVMQHDRSLLSDFGGPIALTRVWSESLLTRMGFVKRKGTKAARKLPENFPEVKRQFLQRIVDVVSTEAIPPELVLNFDQSGIHIVPVSSWTLAKAGESQVPIIGLEDKREITALFTVSLNGDLLPVQLLYKGKTNNCHPNFNFPNDWDVHHTPNHWSNEESMCRYADNILIPYVQQVRHRLSLPDEQNAVAIFDVFRAHQSERFLSKLHNAGIATVFVPANCTSELQPLDLTFNSKFKEYLKEEFSKWYASNVSRALDRNDDISNVSVDLRLSTIKPLHANWFLTAFEKLRNQRDTIVAGFIQSSIKAAIDEIQV